MLYQEQEVSGNPDPVTVMSYYLSGRKGSLNRTYTPSMINNNKKELTLMLFYVLNTDPSNKKVIVINTALYFQRHHCGVFSGSRGSVHRTCNWCCNSAV